MLRKAISPKLRFEVLKRDGFACVYCGRKAGGTLQLVIDHVAPFSKGGADDMSNYTTACNECNAGKAARDVVPPEEVETHAGGPSSLVGMFFHECYPDSLAVSRQGMVEADFGFAVLVRHFEWFAGGTAWWSRLVTKDALTSNYLWYATDEEMRDAWEYGGLESITRKRNEAIRVAKGHSSELPGGEGQ